MGIYIIFGITLIALFLVIKNLVWNKPHEEIRQLKRDIETLQSLHKREIEQLQARLNNSKSLHVQECEFIDITVSTAWKEISELCNKEYVFLGIPSIGHSFSVKSGVVSESIQQRFRDAINEQYKYRYLIYLYPEQENVFDGVNITNPPSSKLTAISRRSENVFELVNLLRKNPNQTRELLYLKNRLDFLEASQSNLTAIPYMAAIMADYETYGLEHLAKELD